MQLAATNVEGSENLKTIRERESCTCVDQSVSMQWSGECQEMYRQAIGQRTMRGSVREGERERCSSSKKQQQIASDAAQRAVFTESCAEGFQARITATICKTGKLKIEGERRRRGSGSIAFNAVIFVECQCVVDRGHATDKQQQQRAWQRARRLFSKGGAFVCLSAAILPV